MPLSLQVQGCIETFLADHDLGSLYREYNWDQDTWENGFSEMRKLEVDLTMAAKNGCLTRGHIIRVARWGRLRNIKRIQCPENIRIALYAGDNLTEYSNIDCSMPLRLLRETIKGIGPTYLSKVLMFSRPQLYAAIDTRLVRTFGNGDKSIEGHGWLSLAVKNYGHGWYIPEYQSSWPGEYDTWIAILHHIAQLCNTSGHKCPHPDQYISIGLRKQGIWIVADIETALFSYASKRVKKEL
ncbi:MAG: hypothetical protein HW384_836 [Dehalococcoidia bacterium]|nr:hypothetical protein [Dehalococcoidia bacterium]